MNTLQKSLQIQANNFFQTIYIETFKKFFEFKQITFFEITSVETLQENLFKLK